jgi:competence protein ComEA
VEWLQLPAIGETLARRIVEDREQRGPFDSLEDVTRVRGIGPGTFAQIRPYLRLDSEPAGANPVPR